jgi:hypothetical protein
VRDRQILGRREVQAVQRSKGGEEVRRRLRARSGGSRDGWVGRGVETVEQSRQGGEEGTRRIRAGVEA